MSIANEYLQGYNYQKAASDEYLQA